MTNVTSITLPQAGINQKDRSGVAGRQEHSNAVAQDIQTIAANNVKPVHALYIHIPYCFHKCHYCDFYSIVDDRTQPAFAQALAKELAFKARLFSLKPTTIFIGGGTPTYLPAEHWRPILAALHDHGVMENVKEFTVEANPETVTEEIAKTLADAGVNRMSLGAQSFQPQLLKALERWHDPTSIPRSLDILRGRGITNLNIDLIFSIPGQTEGMLADDLEQAIRLDLEHVSYYGLTYEPNTVLTKKLELGRVKPTDEETERGMFQRVMDTLTGAGFRHYEISNYARVRQGPADGQPVDRRCAHNLAYWNRLNWLGAGPGAGSHHEGWLWKNLPHLGRYIADAQDPPRSEFDCFDSDRLIAESLMLGLRLIDGIEAEKFGVLVNSTPARRTEAEYLLQIGMLEKAGGRVRLSRPGLFVADEVIGRLI